MEHSQSIISCHVEGITGFPHPSSPLDILENVEGVTSAVRILLSAFGNYGFDDTPQFSDDALLLAVVAKQPGAPQFSAARFDLYARNVAEFIDATNDGRKPLLTHDDHGLVIDEIEHVCESLKALGEVSFRIEEMPMITIARTKKRPKDRRKNHIIIDVASAKNVACLKCERKMLVMSDTKAKALKPGDSINPYDAKGARLIRRSVGSLVRIIDATEAVTADMFDDDDNGD